MDIGNGLMMTDAFDARLGAAVNARRAAQGLTQAQLGDALGVTFQQIQKYERGTNRISAASLARIAVVLDTTASELMGETFATDLPGARSLLTSWSKLTPEQRAAVVNLVRSFTR